MLLIIFENSHQKIISEDRVMALVHCISSQRVLCMKFKVPSFHRFKVMLCTNFCDAQIDRATPV